MHLRLCAHLPSGRAAVCALCSMIIHSTVGIVSLPALAPFRPQPPAPRRLCNPAPILPVTLGGSAGGGRPAYFILSGLVLLQFTVPLMYTHDPPRAKNRCGALLAREFSTRCSAVPMMVYLQASEQSFLPEYRQPVAS